MLPSPLRRVCLLVAVALAVVATTAPAADARIIQRCDLARQLLNFGYPRGQLATWVCIAAAESSMNTTAVGPPNRDGSRDHGLFQINDRYWCSPPGSGKGCGVACAALETDDITKTVRCARKVYEETKRLRGDGFRAWSTYGKCRSPRPIDDCFK